MRVTVSDVGSALVAAALNVSVTTLTMVPSSAATLLTPPALTALTLSGGSAVVFTYTYSATGLGTYNFSAVVAGFDGNFTGQTVTATNLISVLNRLSIQPASPILSAVLVAPLTRTLGQLMTLVMTVSNSGPVTATNVNFTPSSALQVSPALDASLCQRAGAGRRHGQHSLRRQRQLHVDL